VTILACCLGRFYAGIVKLNLFSEDCVVSSKKYCQTTMKGSLSFPSSQSYQIYFCQKYHFRNAKYWHDGRRKLSLRCRQSFTVRELL